MVWGEITQFSLAKLMSRMNELFETISDGLFRWTFVPSDIIDQEILFEMTLKSVKNYTFNKNNIYVC